MIRILLGLILCVSICASLSGFLFEDNKSSDRWTPENGEITYRLPNWSTNIGYRYFNTLIDI